MPLRCTGNWEVLLDTASRYCEGMPAPDLDTDMVVQLRRRERAALAAERERVAQDLHDHVIQRIFAVGLRRRLSEIAAGANSATLPVTMRVDGPVDTLVPPSIAAHVEAVVREAVSNAVRHSHGTAVGATVTVGDEVIVTVTDDGCGIGDAGRRSGLANMAARAEACSGEIVIDSTAAGTTARWRAPLP